MRSPHSLVCLTAVAALVCVAGPVQGQQPDGRPLGPRVHASLVSDPLVGAPGAAPASSPSVLDRPVSVRLKDVRRDDALTAIAASGAVEIAFSPDVVPVQERVSIVASDLTLSEALRAVLHGLDVELWVDGTHVVIVPASAPAPQQVEISRSATPRLASSGTERQIRASIVQGVIAGRVTDAATGAPLAGASVVVEGTALGAQTDAEGRYSLRGVPAGTHRLRVLRIGYAAGEKTVTVVSGQSATVDFALAQQALALEGIVAVGYGTQKKVNLTGAVTSVDSEELTKRPVANMSEALQGAAPGLTVVDRGGRPGESGTDLKIRGIGTLGNANPLILIDGIEGDLDDIDPNDVETISVLKDAASAAIYGSRAANGVILVTTKRGSRDGELRVSYDGYYGIQNLASMPARVGIEDYLRLTNESHVNAGLKPKYSEEYIQNTLKAKRGEADPLLYPDTDWFDVIFNPAPVQDHSVRVTGGNELAAFALSLNYLNQNGMVANTAADRYGMRLNTDWNLSERLEGGLNIALRRASDVRPHELDQAIHRSMHGTPPMVVARYPDGTYGWSDKGHNALAYAEASGLAEQQDTEGMINAKLDYDILDGLSLRTSAAVEYGFQGFEDFENAQTFYDYFERERVLKRWTSNGLQVRESNDAEMNLRAMLDYDRVFDDHGVTALLGYEQTAYDWEQIRVGREGFYNNELREINVGDASRQETWGTSNQWRLRSGFGRLGYNYQGRYLLEASARYDGSSRFADGNRYGFFPSFSAGWRISEEPFLANLDFLDELKLRGSWGRLGNQQIGLYRYFSTIDLGQNYSFGGQLVSGARQTRLANENISWEATEVANLGVDVGLFDGRLAFTGEIYRKNTTGILLTLPIPGVIGVAAPVQNAGEVRNTGWETTLSWRDAVGDLRYSVGFNLSDVTNEVVSLAGTGPYITRWNIIQDGYPIGALYGYQAQGLFQSKEEVASHAKQHPRTGPGDLRYKDQNGDGVINSDDRVVIGSELPRYTLGSNLSAALGSFDASVLFQGVLKANSYITGALAEGPVWENYTLTPWLDRWTPENPNATMPKPTLQLNINTGVVSDFWVKDVSYVKLKNMQIGYTPPESLVGRMGVNALRLYVAGENLLTFTNLDLALDPEFPSGRATGYPPVRIISVGTSFTF
jgi:TonB-linked SusC/RagA family outer membrane protein